MGWVELNGVEDLFYQMYSSKTFFILEIIYSLAGMMQPVYYHTNTIGWWILALLSCTSIEDYGITMMTDWEMLAAELLMMLLLMMMWKNTNYANFDLLLENLYLKWITEIDQG